MATLTKDLCTTLETFSYSRALIGGVALIVIILTRPNANFRETLGQLYPRTPNPFKQERILLQSLLSAGILRHGLAPTPWHSSRTGPRHIPPGALEEKHIDILPRLQIFRLPVGARLEGQLLRDGDTRLPILQAPALTRTEAEHRTRPSPDSPSPRGNGDSHRKRHGGLPFINLRSMGAATPP